MIARLLVTALLATAMLAAQEPSGPPTQESATIGQDANSNQTPAIPPINITVTTPEPSPADLEREREQNQRQVAAQESISGFTRVLSYTAIAQAIIMIFLLVATLRAANAARQSAETTAQSFQMTMIGVLGIKGVFVNIAECGPEEFEDSGPLPRAPAAINVGYTLFNASSVPITMTSFEARYTVSGGTGELVHVVTINEKLTVGKGHAFPLPIADLTISAGAKLDQ